MQSQKNRYKNPFGYKLIYVFRINDDAHKDCLKVGDTTVIYEGSPDDLTPNCRILNSAANARINGAQELREFITICFIPSLRFSKEIMGNLRHSETIPYIKFY